MKAWNRDDNIDGTNPIKTPRGLSIRRVSRTLVTYTLPDQHALQVRGAAFYDSTKRGPFEGALVKLSRADADVGGFLLTYFAEHRFQFGADR